MTKFMSVAPIGNTDPLELPVADAARAAAYYQSRLGFEVVDRTPTAVTITRDAVTLRLVQNGGDPEQASCYVAVSDIDALHREYRARGIGSEIGEMEYDGKTYRLLWVRDPDGICYCLGQPKKAG